MNRIEKNARICYNTNHWLFPSGTEGKATNPCFESENGFGFEEWLGNPIIHNGQCFAFIQGMPISNDEVHHYDRVHLYSYSGKIWYYEGYIDNVDTILDSEAEDAVKHSPEKIAQMIHQIEKYVDIDKKGSQGGKDCPPSRFFTEETFKHPHYIVNVKFLKEDCHLIPNVENEATIHPKSYRYRITDAK